MIYKAIGGVIILALLIAGMVMIVEQSKRAAVEAERRERMSDAIDLIRESDKKLKVVRKASNTDLCRELGGKTVNGVCE